MHHTQKFKGVGVAIVTPFTATHEIDFNALEKIINHLILNKIDYIVSLGTTSETPTLQPHERQQVIDFTFKIVQDRVPVVIGIGGNDTALVVSNLQKYNLHQADAILSVCPYYNKPTQQGLYLHFEKIAQNSPLPIILYNVPHRTGANLNAQTTLQLAANHPNIIAIKEASGDFNQCLTIAKNNPRPNDFMLLSGDDTFALPLMTIGAQGVISVIANALPQEMGNLIHSALQQKYTQASQQLFELAEFITLIFADGNPAGVKALMHHLNLCLPHVRLPLVEATEKTTEKLKQQLNVLQKKQYVMR